MNPKNPPSQDPGPPPSPDPEPVPEVVQSITYAGARYELRLVNCGKANCRRCNVDGHRRPSHGPYWYLRFTQDGRTCRVYMGKNLDTRKFRDQYGNLSMESIRAARANKPTMATPDPGGDPPGPLVSVDADSSSLQVRDATPAKALQHSPGGLGLAAYLEAAHHPDRPQSPSVRKRLRDWWAGKGTLLRPR